MGYYYDADFTITVPETTATAVALNMNTLYLRLNAFPYVNGSYGPDTFNSRDNDGDGIIERMFSYCGFEWNDPQKDADGTIVYDGWANAKWMQATETIVLFLAEHGAGVEMTCRGEDNEQWSYSAEVGSGHGRSDQIVGVKQKYLDYLKSCESLTTKIDGILNNTQDLSDGQVVERLHALLAEVAKAEVAV